jgi:hypothetical protein
MWFTTIDTDRLYVMDKQGNVEIISEKKDESASITGSLFGCTIAGDGNGTIWWGRSRANNGSEIYKVSANGS